LFFRIFFFISVRAVHVGSFLFIGAAEIHSIWDWVAELSVLQFLPIRFNEILNGKKPGNC
jgi:hypothetical protein